MRPHRIDLLVQHSLNPEHSVLESALRVGRALASMKDLSVIAHDTYSDLGTSDVYRSNPSHYHFPLRFLIASLRV